MRRALLLLLGWSALGLAQEEPPKRTPPRAEGTAAERDAATARLRSEYAKPAASWPKPTLDDGVGHRELGLLPAAEHPAANPFTKEKAELGKALFFDGRLSASGQAASPRSITASQARARMRCRSKSTARSTSTKRPRSVASKKWSNSRSCSMHW